MGAGYLLDTNVVIDFSDKKLPDISHRQLSDIIDASAQISVITKIELLGFSAVPPPILTFLERASIISLTDEVVDQTIKLRARYKIKLPDAVIAATAMVFDLALITHNTSDFKNLKGLHVADSHRLNMKII